MKKLNMKMFFCHFFLTVVFCLGCSALSTFNDLHESDSSITRFPPEGIVEVVLTGEVDDDKSTSLLKCETNEEINLNWFRIDTTGERLQLEDLMDGVTIRGDQLILNNDKLDNDQIYSCEYESGKKAYFKIILSESKSHVLDVDSDGAQMPTLFRLDKFKRSYSVIEKEDLKITCILVNRTEGGIDISEIGIKWYMWENMDDLSFEKTLGNCTEDSMTRNALPWKEITGEIMSSHNQLEPHIKFLHNDGIENSMMKIEDAERSDRRGYKCVAYNLTNPDECYEIVTFIRVKDKYAALWPFLGIVAEVVVLCVIIFFFERRRASKEEAEEEDEEDVGSGMQSSSQDKPNVRQRRQ